MKKDQMRFYTHGTAALDFDEIARHEDNVVVAPQPSTNIVQFPAYQEVEQTFVEQTPFINGNEKRSYWQIARDAFGPQEVTTRPVSYASVYEGIKLKTLDKVILAIAFLFTAFVICF